MTASEPIRMCVSCRRRAPQSDLVRLALGPDGVGVNPFRRRGRGAYVCPQKSCLKSAVKRGGVSRGLKTQSPPPSAEQIAVSAVTVVGSRLDRIACCPTAGPERTRLERLQKQLLAIAPQTRSCPRPEGGLAKAHG